MGSEDLIEMYMAHLRERSCTSRTIETYRFQLTEADKHLPFGLDVAAEDEIRAYLWRDGPAPASRALLHAAIVGFYRWAVKANLLILDPTTEIPRPKVRDGLPRVADDEQVRLILTEAPEPYLLWAQLAAYAGLRAIEIYRLRREHVTEQRISVHGKGDKHRLVPTHPVIWSAVQSLPRGPLAHVPSERAISYRFQSYCTRKLRIQVSMHRLRGWMATSGYNASKDARAIQVLLGHSNLATTTRYIAAAVPQQQAVITGLPVFGPTGEDDAPDGSSEPPSLPPSEESGPPADGPDGPPRPPEPGRGAPE